MESKTCRNLPNMALLFILTVTCVLSLSYPAIAQVNKHRLDTYIVHVRLPSGKVFSESESLEGFYHSFFPKTMTSLNKQSRMVYSYRNVVTGFAARLSQGEAKVMERKDGVLSVRKQSVYSLHTTHSPNFLGLHQNRGVWNGSNYGEGVIVGVLDTGITPGHPSFNDQGVPPPPAKWKGKCEFDGAVCNNKLIGARNFVTGDSGPPVDDEGHGTHTSSTATGNFVNNANVFGNANGTAVGMAPLAHVAMYKVCGENCSDSDILAAMDAAIEDGVDVLSLSLGGPSAPFFSDSIAIGAFGAIQKGIFVSCSAGNSGPVSSSLSNEAPWILTVGASTIDRQIEATVVIGASAYFSGESLFQPKDFANNSWLPLVFPGASGDQNVIWCAEGSLSKDEVEGKIVLCERGGGIGRIAKGQAVKDAGGAAMILMNEEVDGYSTLADPHVLPASHVSYASGLTIKQYINSTSSPRATIMFEGTVLGVDSAPAVSSFSSRGPSVATPGILKPDIIGPGVSILAAWPESVDNITAPNASFNMISGTSMSCPHLSGIAALLKSAHPTWSPAAIKSALMTTASVVNLKNQPIVDERLLQADLFAIGAGHVNPDLANDPGLVYDLQPNDYIPYLCGLGYSDDQISVIVGHAVSCANTSTIPEAQLNYPSFSINLGSSVQEFSRVVTNVGDASSSYTVQISSPPGVNVSVTPSTLVFSEVNQQLTYDITFSRLSSAVAQTFVQGYLTWTSSKYAVRSPISVELE